jgi:hypothetical protein
MADISKPLTVPSHCSYSMKKTNYCCSKDHLKKLPSLTYGRTLVAVTHDTLRKKQTLKIITLVLESQLYEGPYSRWA